MPAKDRGSLVPTSERERRLLTEEADEILRVWASERHQTQEKMDEVDFHTRWMTRDRYSREIQVGGGTVNDEGVIYGPGGPDRAVRNGYRYRVLNVQQTWLNSRDPAHSGMQRPRGMATANMGPSGKWMTYNHPSWRFDDGKDWPVEIRWREGSGPAEGEGLPHGRGEEADP